MTAIRTDAERKRWLTFVECQALPLEVTCEPWKEPRTLTQNAFLWRAIYQPLAKLTEFSTDEWHEHYCGEHFGWVEHASPAGHIQYTPRRTTTRNEHGKRDVLKGDAFAAFVSFVEADCAKRGVFIAEQWHE